jgi:hypothetical protein
VEVDKLLDNLKGARQFECLCRDLLLAEGALNLRGAGQGNDQGADLVGDIPVQSPLHSEMVPFLVQCKWYSSGKSVGKGILAEGFSSLDLHQARALLIITTSSFSGTAISHANAISNGQSSPRFITLWDREEVLRRLRRHPMVGATYLDPEAGSAEKPKEHGMAERQDSIERYLSRAVPEGYSAWSVATFPAEHLDETLRSKLEVLEESFSGAPPISLVIKGGVYSGKSGLAWSLLKRAKTAGRSILALDEFDFVRAYFRDEFHGTYLVPQVIRELRRTDVLFIEGVGSVLKDRSPFQLRAAALLKDLICDRVSQGRPVIVESRDAQARELGDYIGHLSSSGDIAVMPSKSVGGVLESLEDRPETATPNPDEGVRYLGRSWLLEKYNKIKRRLDSLRATLLRPEAEHASGEELMYQLSGDRQRSRIQVAVDELKFLSREVDEYATFVEGLPFEAIKFDDDDAQLLL